MNDRLVPYRNRMPQIVADRLQLLDTQTMYLLQTVGPTCYVIKQDDVNYRVRIGSRMLCSCNEKDLCIHVLYVMNKVGTVLNLLKMDSQCPWLDFARATIESADLAEIACGYGSHASSASANATKGKEKSDQLFTKVDGGGYQ